jgi:hypothetical protein
MMRIQDGHEVSEYVWEEMQQASEQKTKARRRQPQRVNRSNTAADEIYE